MRMTILIMMLCAALSGCGGGGSAAPAPKTTAVLKIGTQGTLPAGVTGLSGVSVTITLPQGVAVATDGSGNPAANVAVVSGVAAGGSLAPPTYTPPTATANATLRVVVAAGATLFGTGEFVTVTCLLPAGHNLSASNFPASILSNLQPADQLIQPVNGLTPTIAATLY